MGLAHRSASQGGVALAPPAPNRACSWGEHGGPAPRDPTRPAAGPRRAAPAVAGSGRPQRGTDPCGFGRPGRGEPSGGDRPTTRCGSRRTDRAAGRVARGPTATVALDRPDRPTSITSPVMQQTVPWHRPGTGPIPTANGPVRQRWRKIAGRTAVQGLGRLAVRHEFAGRLLVRAVHRSAAAGAARPGRLRRHWYSRPGTIDEVREQIFIFLQCDLQQEVADNLVGNTVDDHPGQRPGATWCRSA